MKSKEKKLTFEDLKTLAHHRDQLSRKCQQIEWMLTGLDQPLLPEGWTDEDAWKLARSLAKLMGQVALIEHTTFDEQHPYPSHDTPLEDIPYYNAFFDEGPDEFVLEDGEVVQNLPYPEIIEQDISLWAEVLHCGILVAMSNPEFCFPSSGTFAELKELVTGTIMSGGGPLLEFDTILEHLSSTLNESESDFDPVPPVFDKPESTEEEIRQEAVLLRWKERRWANHCPCRNELLEAIDRIQSEHLLDTILLRTQLINRCIDLYLYQIGASNMLEDSYYILYAMLCRTQEQMKAYMEKKEG